MKTKVYCLVSLLIFGLFAVLFANNFSKEVQASTDILQTITQDCEYKDMTIAIDESRSDLIVISNGATVTMKNITFESNTTKINSIFKIEENSKLILDNVDFKNAYSTYGIICNGEVELNNVTFGNATQTSIYINSNAENPCIIHSGVIKSVYLNKGYITVDEYTKFNSTLDKINITIADEFVGRLVVKGCNTFASYYIENFNYVGAFTETISGVEFAGYLDYVGDGLSLKVGDYTFSQGDIILTTYKIRILNGDYFAGMYCTANSYIYERDDDYSPQSILVKTPSNTDGIYMDNIAPLTETRNQILHTEDGVVNCIISLYDTETNSRLSYKSLDIPICTKRAVFVEIPEGYELDNFDTQSSNVLLIKNFENRMLLRFIIDCSNIQSGTNASLNINFKEKETIPVVNITKEDSVQVTFPSDVKIGDTVTITFTISEDLLLERVVFNSEDVEYILNNQVYEIEVEMLSENNLIITTKNKPVITYVDVKIDIIEFEYNKTNQYDDIKPYYILNENKVDVEYELYSGGIKTFDFTNAGSYEVRFLHTLENISFKNTSQLITLSQKELSVVYSQSNFVYDGTEKVVTVSLKGVETGDSVELLIENNKRTQAGSQDILVSIGGNDNYILDSDAGGKVLVVEQAEIDINAIEFNNVEYDYCGSDYTLTAGNIPEGVSVTYKNNINSNAGTYVAIAYLNLIDQVNYKPLTKNSLQAVMIIKPANIDTSKITFGDIIITYSGNEVIAEVSGDIPEQVNDIGYTYYLLNASDEIVSEIEYPIDAGKYLVIADFKVYDTNYNDIANMSTYITINKALIQLEDISFEDKIVTYSGDKYSIMPINVPSMLGYEVDKKDLINAGTYIIVATFTCDNNNYESIGEYKLTATLKISKATYDMSNVTLSDLTTPYDRTYKKLKISGTLPDGVTVKYLNNNKVDAGTYNVTASFIGSSNYNEIPSLTAKLTITPKVLSVSLVNNSFIYDGETKTVTLSISGLLVGDMINIKLINNSNTNAGNYMAQIDSVSNTNYIVGNADLSYVIRKANVDMSGVSFVGKEIEYDGNIHMPNLLGEIPAVVTTSINSPNAMNVGNYTCVVDFYVNDNYNRPQSMTCEIKILPKPIFVSFSNYTKLVEDGTLKNIDIEFTGVLESDFDDYSIVYSQEPIVSGNYNCSVILDSDSNYKIIGSSSIDFVILTPVKNYVDSNISIEITGDGFLPDSKLNIYSTSDDQDIVTLLNNAQISVDSYKKIKLSVDGDNEDNFAVALDMGNINNVNYLKVYKIVDNKLVMVDYVFEDGRILFNASDEDEFILVQENNMLVQNIAYIMLLSILFTLAIASLIVFMVINKKSKNGK